MSELSVIGYPVRSVKVMYTNYRGETRLRHIFPTAIWYGSTQWHPEVQWLVQAVDMEDGKLKDFNLLGFKGDSPEYDIWSNITEKSSESGQRIHPTSS